MIPKYFNFLLLLMFFVGFVCKNENLNHNTDNKIKNDSVYHCKLTDSLSMGINELESDSQKFSKNYSQMDICYLAFIDSLYSNFIGKSDSKYLGYISLIAGESDGYVSEYLVIITENLFINKSKLLISYFYDNRMAPNRPLENFFIDYLKKEINNSKERKKTINSFQEKANSEGYNSDERKYFDKLIDSAHERLEE